MNTNNTNNINFANDSNFIFYMENKENKDILYLTDFALPGVSVATIRQDFFNSGINLNGTKVGSDKITLSAYVDEKLDNYESIVKKIYSVNPITNEININTDYVFDSYVIILDSQGMNIKTIKYKNCIFSDISGLTYSTKNEADVLTFDISLDFDWWDFTNEFDITKLNDFT